MIYDKWKCTKLLPTNCRLSWDTGPVNPLHTTSSAPVTGNNMTLLIQSSDFCSVLQHFEHLVVISEMLIRKWICTNIKRLCFCQVIIKSDMFSQPSFLFKTYEHHLAYFSLCFLYMIVNWIKVDWWSESAVVDILQTKWIIFISIMKWMDSKEPWAQRSLLDLSLMDCNDHLNNQRVKAAFSS